MRFHMTAFVVGLSLGNFVGGWMRTGDVVAGLVQGLVTIPLFYLVAWLVGWFK